jgi:ABC-type bacteriocin/lantibiotic exporter with double-glycine peptidase domain
MNRAAEGTLEIGSAIKGLLMTLGSLAVFGYGIYLLVQGRLVAGLLLIFIGEPIILFIADLATAAVLGIIVAIAGFLGWSLKRHGREDEVEELPAWDPEAP